MAPKTRHRQHIVRLIALSVLVVGALTLAAPASAVSLYAAYWDTNDLGEAGGVGLGFKFGRKLALEIAGTYYEELDEDPFDLLEDGESPFVDGGFDVIPIDAGFRWSAGTGLGGGFYLGVGATLFMIDSNVDGVEVDDEAGWYAKIGYDFGNGRGTTFFVEGLLRQVDTDVGVELGFIDEATQVNLDLEGVSVHFGIRF